MKLESSTVLVTGGASGIGYALAERFLGAGSRVIVCGRREEKLRGAQAAHPKLAIRVCDLARESERISLFQWAVREFPHLNVLVNNAGIQRSFRLDAPEEWPGTAEEIAINFEAPVHLAMLFVPHLKRQSDPAIVNVTSGLSFSPLARVPVYSATKAAMHSFTLSLRRQLGEAIEVVELVPPAVDTDLGGPGLHTFGVPVSDFVGSAMEGIARGEREIAYGFSQKASRASREELDGIFRQMNS
ncbi:MAG: SDR family NAD(P)-dependent oxidoreductase [Acidobacteriota bacterium]